jgi:hypothetical protein
VLRLFLLLNFVFFNLLACEGGYLSCIKKVNDSNLLQNKSLHIPIKNYKLLIYSKQTPNTKILKHDPFLSLYIIEDKQKFKFPFDINMRLQLGSAIVNEKTAIEGKIIKNQVGLNSLAIYSEVLSVPAIISSSCCSLEGIVTPRGVIQKEYIKRFISSKKVEYGDIGIRVKDNSGFVVVSAINPFMKNNPFKKADKILSFDGKKVKSASIFMKKVLFSKVGSKHKLKVKRGSKIISLNVTTKKRYGGGDLSDTFLEQKGIYFDKKLHIVSLSKHFKDNGLRVGDKLIQVNGVAITTEDELRRYIEDFKDYSSLLLERNKFQFFINIKPN